MTVILDGPGMIEHVYQNPETKVGKGLCPSHIVKVWKNVNTLIQRSLCSGRGVKLSKFFEITSKIVAAEPHVHHHSHAHHHSLPQTATDLDAILLKKHPHVYLAEELVTKHNIFAKEHYPDPFELPQVDLNLSHVAKLSHLSRKQVELCLDEIFIAFDRALEEDDHVELVLNDIGKVVISSGVVKTEFSHSFLSLLGYSENIKRCFYPNPPQSARLSSFVDYPASATPSSDETEPDDDEFGHRSFLNLEEEDEFQVVEIPPTPPEVEEEADLIVESHEALPILEETEEDKIRRSNAHRTLLERECVVRENFLVWETISKYIIRKMIEGIAVRIPGLGTFTHSILPNDSTNTTFEGVGSLRKSRKFPIFKICRHLKEMNSLTEENELFQCNAPVMNLNTGIIAKESRLTHGIVDGLLTETLQTFARGVITNKTIQFPFPFIGKLHVEERNVYMLFYEEFCEGLEFNFRYDPSYISSVIPGQMTPLVYHRPPPHFTSVFHYKDMKGVDESMRASTPCVYGEGEPVICNESGDGCNHRELPPHSRLICSCCKCRKGKSNECEAVADPEDKKNSFLGYDDHSRSNERIRKACCAQSGSISFRQPDGSSFSPEALFIPAKTGNLVLDKLADDSCLMQQALGDWMKRNFVKTLGREEVLKHYDRDCFKSGEFNLEEEVDGPKRPASPRDSIISIPASEEAEKRRKTAEEGALLSEEVASENEASPSPSPTDSALPLDNFGSLSIKSTESFLRLPKFTGKDSMIMGLNQLRRNSLDSAKRRMSGKSNSLEVSAPLEEPEPEREENDDKSIHSQSGMDTTPGTSMKDETASAADNSDVDRHSIKSTPSDNLDDDRESSSRNVNKEETTIATSKGTDVTPEDDDQKNSNKTIADNIASLHSMMSVHSRHSHKQEDTAEEFREESPAPATVHLFESDQASEMDQEAPIHLELGEDEVIQNLGLKRKKRCKHPTSKHNSKDLFMPDQ